MLPFMRPSWEAQPVDLFEYQGKQFFGSFDIPVSAGEAVTTVDDAVAAAERLNTYPVVVKAPVSYTHLMCIRDRYSATG